MGDWSENVQKLLFLIKWVGYDDEADQTWEPEENCEYGFFLLFWLSKTASNDTVLISITIFRTAQEAQAAYFKEIGGRPVQKPAGKTPTGKRGPRNSLSSTPVTSTKAKKQKSTEVPEIDTWKPPISEASWEDEVRCIDTLERNEDGIVVYVHW